MTTTYCDAGHLHESGRPTVVVLAVDAARHLLLERADADQAWAWTLPAAAMTPGQRTSTAAALLVAQRLGLTTFDVEVLAPAFTDQCDLGGLHLQYVVVERLTQPVDNRCAWIPADPDEDLGLAPAVSAFADRAAAALGVAHGRSVGGR